MDFLDGIKTEFENFLYRAFIDTPQMYDSDINKYHDCIYKIIKDMLENTHNKYLVEEESEE